MRRDLGAGLLSLEECARRIKDLRQQGEALFKRKVELQKKGRAAAKILPIPTPMMNAYIRQLKTAEFDLVWPRKLKTDRKQTCTIGAPEVAKD